MRILYILLLFICSAQAEDYRTISFKENPFENTFMGEKWRSSVEAPWRWSQPHSHLHSARIRANQKSACEFQFDSEEGFLEIHFSAALRGSKQYSTIYLDDKIQKMHSAIKEEKLRFKVKRGTHIVKFIFHKSVGASGGGACYIKKLKYKPLVENFIHHTIRHSDAKTQLSWGNKDGIAQSFEVVSMFLEFKSSKNISPVTYKIKVPKHVLMIKHDSFPGKMRKEEKKQIHFSLLANGQYQEDKIPVEIIIKSHKVLLKKINYSIPYIHIDPARAFLKKKTPVISKKFDFSSEKQLDQFLNEFPQSEFAPMIFLLRLECCRKIRNQVTNKNVNIDDRQQQEKNLIIAINSYLTFIEKYPQRLLSKIAIHELFQLYTKINRISFYYNFIERFPQSEHSLVAEEHIKSLVYLVVCEKNSTEAYDNFIKMYPNPSFLTQKCAVFAQEKEKEKEQKFIQKLIEEINAKDKYIQELVVQLKRNKRANELMNQWLLLINQRKDITEKNELFLNGIHIQRIKRILASIYKNTNAITTVLMMEKLDEIANTNQEIKNLQLQLHKETIQQIENHFSSLQKSIEDNFSQTNSKIKDVHLAIKDLHKNLKWMHASINEKISSIDEKIIQGFSELNQNLQQMESRLIQEARTGTVAKYLTLLHHNLNTINSSIKNANRSILQLNKENKNFVQQNQSLLKIVKKNGTILNGWKKYRKNSSLHTSVSKTVVNVLKQAVGFIPVVGPITNKVAAPFIKWIGDQAGDGAVSLWQKIF